MSRTYRRGKSVVPEWVKRKCTKVKIDGRRILKYETLQGMDLIAEVAKFHSDAQDGGIPSSFKEADKGIKRAKDKIALDKINKYGYYDEYSFDLHRKDYDYKYW